MTIACGMRFREGIMVFADSEHDGYDLKTFGTKIFPEVFDWGSAIFSYSGPEAIGKTAIRKCVRALRRNPVEDVDGAADVVQSVIHEDYAAHVWNGSQENDFSIIFAVFHGTTQAIELYASSTSVVAPYPEKRCVGVGAPLAYYLIESKYSPDLDLDSASMLAVHALTNIKDRIPGCGGPTEIVVLGSDGAISPIHFDTQMEGDLQLFDIHTSLLRSVTIRPDLDHGLFEQTLKLFSDQIRDLRGKIELRMSLGAMLRRVPIQINPIGISSPESTRGGPSLQQPSPELPEASDES